MKLDRAAIGATATKLFFDGARCTFTLLEKNYGDMMSKPMGIQEAVRLARSNAAALIEAMDLEQLYGGDDFC